MNARQLEMLEPGWIQVALGPGEVGDNEAAVQGTIG